MCRPGTPAGRLARDFANGESHPSSPRGSTAAWSPLHPLHTATGLCAETPRAPIPNPPSLQPRCSHGGIATWGPWGRDGHLQALASPGGAAAGSGRGRRGNPPAPQNKHARNPHLKVFRNWDFICCSHGCITMPSSAPSPSHRSDRHRAPERGFLGVISKVTDTDGGFCSAAPAKTSSSRATARTTAPAPAARPPHPSTEQPR